MTQSEFRHLVELHNRRCNHDVIGVAYDELLALRAAINIIRPLVDGADGEQERTNDYD